MRSLLVWLALAIGAAVSMQARAAGAQVEPTVTWIRDVRVWSGIPGSAVRERAWVELCGDRVGRIEDEAPTPRPDAAIDGSGCTLLPGLFDLHVHLGATAAPFEASAAPRSETFARAALACGVTTLFDLHGDEDELLRLRAVSRTDVTLPRVLAAGSALTVVGGHGTEGGHPARIVNDPESARAAVADAIAHGADVIKVMFERGGWGGMPAQSCMDEATLLAVIESAHALGARVVVHAVERDAALFSVEHGADVLAHLPFEGALDQDFVERVRKSGAAVMPTLAAYGALAGDDLVGGELEAYVDPSVRRAAAAAQELSERAAALSIYFNERLPRLRDALFRLHRAGVVLLPGSDAGMPGAFHGPATAAEFRAWIDAGIPPEDALTAFTYGAATFLGEAERRGAVTSGRVADLLLVDGDPCADASALTRVRAVWRAGVLVDRAAVAALFVASRPLQPVADAKDRGVSFDFESETGALPRHTRFPESDEPGKAELVVSAVRDYGEANATSFLRIDGTLARGLPHRRRLAVTLLPAAGDVFEAVGAEDLRFRLRASARGEFRVRLLTRDVTDGDAFAATIAVDTEWRTYRVPFQGLAQVGFGRRVAFDSGAILGIEFATPIGAVGTFRVDVDDVEFGPQN
ncbi:MAG: amidohydrolase family protein [Planctomycetes bacterium]|nr:amidohydrolase family protein [Planctomycetota bacterium]